MSDESMPGRESFGELHPIGYDRLGLVTGGALGGGFGWLHKHTEQERWGRGFLGQADRRFLLETLTNDLTTASARSARQRIRKRVVSTFFDARLLRYIDRRDRQLIFENARDAGYELHFQEGFKELIRFTYLGLLELEADLDIQRIIETAVQEAERDYALNGGENSDFQADINLTRVGGGSIDELERRYDQQDNLTRRELAVLVNSQHTNSSEQINAADISLADALYYAARQPTSDPHGYSWEDPDRDEAEDIVEWLRSVFEEYSIESYDELEAGINQIRIADEELGDELTSKLNRLPRVAPNFESQLAIRDGLSPSEEELLHHILYNPDNIDVAAVLEQKARPPTAGEDWNPAEDEYLQKFIARIEFGGSPTGGEEGAERWNRVLELAGFEEDEWDDYIHDE